MPVKRPYWTSLQVCCSCLPVEPTRTIKVFYAYPSFNSPLRSLRNDPRRNPERKGSVEYYIDRKTDVGPPHSLQYDRFFSTNTLKKLCDICNRRNYYGVLWPVIIPTYNEFSVTYFRYSPGQNLRTLWSNKFKFILDF